MIRQRIPSSHIRSIGHDIKTGLLEVEFVNGSVYQYQNVPHAAYREIITRPSAGATFDSLIKSKPFRTTKIQ